MKSIFVAAIALICLVFSYVIVPDLITDKRVQNVAFAEGTMEPLPTDAWGNQIILESEIGPQMSTFLAISKGRDEVLGTDDDIVFAHTAATKSRFKKWIDKNTDKLLDKAVNKAFD